VIDVTKIAPSILSADFARLGDGVKAVEAAGADWIHVDVMDGVFVPNITIGAPVVKALDAVASRPLDVHLMIDKPERFLEDFAAAGADVISIHPEACLHLQRALGQIRELGAKASVALNPSTPLDAVEWVLDDCDMILIMSVNPGFGGQEFIPSALPKIRRLKEMTAKRGLEIEIQVDGGVKADNAARIVEAGATVIVVGSGIFKHPKGIEAAIKELRQNI
jgi:ribulose-phosphate 3-epimerase